MRWAVRKRLAASCVVALFVLAFVAQSASAQPVYLDPIGSLQNFEAKVQAQDTVTVWICIKRVDVTPPVVVGCQDAQPMGQTTVVPIVETVTVDDAPEWRAFAYSSKDEAIALESEPSARAGTTNSFFRPIPPVIQP